MTAPPDVLRDRALLAYLTETVWALEPTVLANLAAIVGRHASGVRLSAADLAALGIAPSEDDIAADTDDGYTLADGVAIIDISGVVARHASQVNGVSQPTGTSCEAIAAHLDRAESEASSVLLRIDSPGGSASAIAETAAEIASLASRMPVAAYADGSACSAAYWLAAAAGAVSGSRSAMVGSIGAYAVVCDSSQAAADAGLSFRVIRSGPHKGGLVDGVPVTDDGIRPLADRIEAIAGLFAADVAAWRSIDADRIASVADGRVWTGIDAVASGLLDRIEPFAAALAATPETPLRPARDGQRIYPSAHANERKSAMAEKTNAPPAADEQQLAAAEQAGAAAARASLTALQAAFGDDPAYALEAAAAGLTVESAKAAAYDRLRAATAEASADADAKLKALTDENAKLKALLGSAGIRADGLPAFDASDGAEPAGGEAKSATDTPDAYRRAVTARIEAGDSEGAAHAAAAKALPKAHAAWIAAGAEI